MESFVVGFDCEWVDKRKVEEKQYTPENLILSYQFYAHFENKNWSGIHYPKGGKRITLSSLISLTVSDGIKKGLIKKWPTSVKMVAHWTLADLSAFKDFHSSLKLDFDTVRKTYITRGKPIEMHLYDRNRNAHKCRVSLYDSMLLSPQGKSSLASLGEFHNIPKIDLPDGYEKARMDIFLRDKKEIFEKYAVRDAEISAKHLLYIKDLAFKITGKKSIPITLGGLALTYTLKFWKEQKIDFNKFFGVVRERTTEPDEYTGQNKKVWRYVHTIDRHIYENFARECYHGGRNETYIFGATEEDIFTDWDLSGAYTTAMAMIGFLRYDKARITDNIADFLPNVLGYANIAFKFPSKTKFPCLPVRTPTGLIFPLEGETQCCAPEIYLATRMGATIKIKKGLIVPTDDEKPFRKVIESVQRNRQKFNKGSLEDLIWKEMGNSLYGKTAQGLTERRVFDNRSGRTKEIPASRITNPFIAAYITSFIRSTISEIIAAIPTKKTVINLTTDGLLTNATDDEMKEATTGPICRIFSQTRFELTANPTVLEKKHKVGQVLAWRTRGQATLSALPNEKALLAKAGLKPPENTEPNAWIIETFENRDSMTTQTFKTLVPLSVLFKRNMDLVELQITRKIGMDYDWKRKYIPDSIAMRKVRTIEHLYFDTNPWNNFDEYIRHRELWEAYKNKSSVVLKTVGDLFKFEDYIKANTLQAQNAQLKRKAGTLQMALRQFIRAYVRSEWGLYKTHMSFRELSGWLEKGGYKFTVNNIKNASRIRLKLVKNAIAQTPEVLKLIDYIKATFCNFDETELLEVVARETLVTKNEVFEGVKVR